MKFEGSDPVSFANEGVMDEEECLGTILEDKGTTIGLETTEDKQKETFLIVPEESGPISSIQADRWRKLSRQIRGALAIKNAAVKPNRRRSGRKSTTNIDPFLQKFSTREIGLATQISGTSLHSIEEENDNFSPGEDAPKDTNENQSSKFFPFKGSLTLSELSPTGVIDPDGAFLYYWAILLITAVRYNLWVVILRFAFVEAQDNHSTLWWVLDSVADLIYLLDIFVNCRVGFFEEGILLRDPKLACKGYIMSCKFFLDIISLLPLEFLYFKTGVKPILRFPRLLKIYKSQEVKAKIESRANHPTIVRVFFLVHLMFLLLHWNAGIYFLISRAEGFGSNGWGYPALNGSHDTLTRKYVHSFYWSALTLTTIGDLPSPETNVEYFYTIACYLSGVFVFAMIVGNAGSIILDRNASRMEFEKQRDNAKNYMEIHNVPGDLQRRVLKWYDYSWSRGRMSGGSGDLNSLHLLPDKMKTEIALHVHLETLKKVTFLQNCEPEFLHDLLLKMRLHIFTPGDLIIRHGEIAREMYLIAHGRIEVISETGTVLKELGSGDFFGEIGILSLSEGQNRRTADVRSIGYTECFVLSKDDVLGEIHQFPQAQKILAEYGKKRLKNTSGDPRLVKLDGQDSPVAKSRWKATQSRLVNMLNEKESPGDETSRNLTGLFKSVARDVVTPSLNSPGNVAAENSNEKTMSNTSSVGRAETPSSNIHMSCARDQQDETRDQANQSCDHSSQLCEQLNKSRDVSSGSQCQNSNACETRAVTTREAITTNIHHNNENLGKTENNNSREKTYQPRGSTRESSRTRDSVTCHPRDIGTCLNTLDYLKAVLQSTMHETEKQNGYVTQIERELAKEKEKIKKAEEKLKSQEEEIRRLLQVNKTLNERLEQKDVRISEIEDVFQVNESKKESRTGSVCVELSEGLSKQRAENVFSRETVLDISDTQC